MRKSDGSGIHFRVVRLGFRVQGSGFRSSGKDSQHVVIAARAPVMADGEHDAVKLLQQERLEGLRAPHRCQRRTWHGRRWAGWERRQGTGRRKRARERAEKEKTKSAGRNEGRKRETERRSGCKA
eukprot:2977727-Rhodomonas_salina.2